MAKVALTRASQGSKKWQIVSFEGPKGCESKGIVDFMAIRKDHKTVKGQLKEGDLFEIVLIQAKGGKARKPTEEDRRRLWKVGKYYKAKYVVLSEWKKGEFPIFKKLSRYLEWEDVATEAIFK